MLFTFYSSTPTLNDLEMLKPSVGKHLRQLLEYEGDDFEKVYEDLRFEVQYACITVHVKLIMISTVSTLVIYNVICIKTNCTSSCSIIVYSVIQLTR